MAQTLIINGVTYQNVPYTRAPIVNSPDPEDPTDYGWYYDVSDATLDNGSKMLNGVIGYGANGVKYTGSILTKTASDLTASGATVTVPAGYYASQATKSVQSGSASGPASITGTSATVSTSNNTITLSKTISVTPVVSAGYVSSGTATNSSVSLTASVTTKAAATITPGTSNQTIASGTYLTGAQTILGDSDLKAENIKTGVNIFGIDGTLSSVAVSQDPDTKGLTIS